MNRHLFKKKSFDVSFSRSLPEPDGLCTKSMGFPVNYCFTTLCNSSVVLVHWWSKSKVVYGMLMILHLHLNVRKVFRKALKIIFVTFFKSILVVNGQVSKWLFALPNLISWYYSKWSNYWLHNRTFILLLTCVTSSFNGYFVRPIWKWKIKVSK